MVVMGGASAGGTQNHRAWKKLPSCFNWDLGKQCSFEIEGTMIDSIHIDIDKLRLTDQELAGLVNTASTRIWADIAEAQLAKAMYGILKAIDHISDIHSGEFPAGYFTDMLLEDMEAAGLLQISVNLKETETNLA